MAERRTSKSSASAAASKGGAKTRGSDTGQETKKPRASASAKGNASKAAAGSGDRDQRVRDRAYQIWEQEGRPSGRDSEHWERANREIGS